MPSPLNGKADTFDENSKKVLRKQSRLSVIRRSSSRLSILSTIKEFKRQQSIYGQGKPEVIKPEAIAGLSGQKSSFNKLRAKSNTLNEFQPWCKDSIVFDTKKDQFGEYYVDMGSVDSLLHNLMWFNMSFVNVFLDTFVLFIQPRELFNFLVKQYKNNEIIPEKRPRCETLPEATVDRSSDQISVGLVPRVDQNLTNSTTSIDVDAVISVKRDSNASIATEVSALDFPRKETITSNTYSVNSNVSMAGTAEPSAMTAKTTRIIALKILRKWISSFYYDFENDTSLLNDLVMFLSNAEEEIDRKDPMWRQINLVSITLKEIKKPLEISNDTLRDEDITWDILKHQEVAETLTSIEYHLFKSLGLRELLAYVFGRSEDRRDKAASVVKIIENSTKLTYLVEAQIVKYPSSRVRALEMETWIAVVKDLYEVKNYSSLIAILGALNSTAVDRMEKTKRKVNAKKRKTKADIEEDIGISNYYDKLRVFLDNNTHVHAIPFIGNYITIFDRLKQNGILTTDNKVKFKTCRHISKLLQSISTRQRYYICREGDSKKVMYMKKILNLPSLTTEEIAALSYRHEPRNSNS